MLMTNRRLQLLEEVRWEGPCGLGERGKGGRGGVGGLRGLRGGEGSVSEYLRFNPTFFEHSQKGWMGGKKTRPK